MHPRTLPRVLPLLGLLLFARTSPAQVTGAEGIVAEGAQLEQATTGLAFAEGPAADRTGNVYFTDQPNNRILKWSTDGSVALYMQPAGRANGLFVDDAGNLVACADEDNQLWRIAPDKSIGVLVLDVDGVRLNGPNDVWVAPEGDLYFTDPYYQRDYWARTEPDLAVESVYRLAPDGRLAVADVDLVKPNGIVGSADGTLLYVADIGADRTYVYTRDKDGTLTGRRVFTRQGSDGMTTDAQGNVYLTGAGVSIYDAAGRQIGHIAIDEPWTSNVTFGGPDHDVLFITTVSSLYTLQMAVRGARW